ncbi:glycosyl hydrolase family 28-related protein [Burkholderia sp. 22PA0106]|uniref:glycosyl hydrolase family 28-related protein n=1 Tax=Burkholderia sp. 22PA0106 TaxID=3237371 RepID=UPI0039C01898
MKWNLDAGIVLDLMMNVIRIENWMLTKTLLTNGDAMTSKQEVSKVDGRALATSDAQLSDLPVTPQDFGAKGDGVTIDTAALSAWLAAISITKSGYIPAGTYLFDQPLQKSGDGITIRGDGYASILKYVGASTTVDIIVFGDGSNNQSNWTLEGFRVTSGTTMTQGYALRMKRFSDSFVEKVIADGMDGGRTLWSGYFFDGCHEVWVNGFGATCQWDGMAVSGNDNASNADLYLSNGYLNFCGTAGLRCGGGFGGLFIGDNVEILGNIYAGLLVDNSINNLSNREFIISDGATFDGLQSNTQYDILVDSPDSDSGQISIDCFMGSAKENAIYVKSWANGGVSIGSPQIFNCLGDGIRVDDPTIVMTISDNTIIRSNQGYGINATVALNTEIHGSPYVSGNNLGDWSALTYRAPIQLPVQAGWTSSAIVNKKSKRCIVNGSISQAAGAVSYGVVVANIPQGYIPAFSTSLVIVYSGGNDGDGIAPGRVNLDGTVQVLKALTSVVNLAFIGAWDIN